MAAQVRGIAEVKKQLAAARERLRRAVGAAVYALGNDIMSDSKQRVPVDLGALKGSGYVTLPVVDAQRAVVELGYGGPAKAYAVVQHERTEFHHEVGEAKFLENAVNAASGQAARRVQQVARDAFDRDIGATSSGLPQTPDQE